MCLAQSSIVQLFDRFHCTQYENLKHLDLSSSQLLDHRLRCWLLQTELRFAPSVSSQLLDRRYRSFLLQTGLCFLKPRSSYLLVRRHLWIKMDLCSSNLSAPQMTAHLDEHPKTESRFSSCLEKDHPQCRDYVPRAASSTKGCRALSNTASDSLRSSVYCPRSSGHDVPGPDTLENHLRKPSIAAGCNDLMNEWSGSACLDFSFHHE